MKVDMILNTGTGSTSYIKSNIKSVRVNSVF